jgi:Tol biopolymer transport system component
MKTTFKCIISLLLVSFGVSYGQLAATKIERIAITGSEEWNAPMFSPNGKKIYFTNSSYNGIWEFSFDTKQTRLITSDQGSGYGFALSQDGNQIAYRRTSYPKGNFERVQEIISHDLKSNKKFLLAKGDNLSIPIFTKSGVTFSDCEQTKNLSPKLSSKEISVLGIENTKIALNRNGTKVLLDPFAGGSYIWPHLSPDKSKIAVYEADRGTFICDINGNILSKLGKRNAAVWSRDGNWLIYMDDIDDGHNILSSEIKAVSIDGKLTVTLTNTSNIIEMNPSVSPTENKIVCNSFEGQIFVIHYEDKSSANRK